MISRLGPAPTRQSPARGTEGVPGPLRNAMSAAGRGLPFTRVPVRAWALS
jgi:hypothetical protein